MATTTWECPRCHRRVPLRVGECHCGTPRPQPGATPSPVPLGGGQASARDVPWAVWAWLGVIVVATLLGIYWALRPGEPNPIVPVLGHIDRGPQSPAPKASPTPRPK